MGLFEPDEIKRERRTLAGREISVTVTPPLGERSLLAAPAGLLKGMGVTMNYLSHPSKIVTRQYPENRATLKFPPRYRAMLQLVYEGSGYHRCTGCRICERACPNASIKIISRRGASGKIEIDRYIWRMDSCTFCNACVQACPFDALEMTHQFENAVYDRRLLIFTLNRYAGPPASILEKEPDPQKRQAMIEPRDRYGGPVPMSGQSIPDVHPLGPPAQGEADTAPLSQTERGQS